ncbi:hypothetical protein CsSME_00042840 [Camellia sinensis var. sinensis]
MQKRERKNIVNKAKPCGKLKYYVGATQNEEIRLKHWQEDCIPPPPFMIFGSKLKVCQSHIHKSSYYDKNYENNKQDGIYGVSPETPYANKQIVELNVDNTKRQYARHCHLGKNTPVPTLWRNHFRTLGGVARSLELRLTIFCSDSTQKKQW